HTTISPDPTLRGAYSESLREHAPLAERVATLAERLAHAPAALEGAKANLDPALVPPEFVEIALRSVPAGATFLRVGTQAMVPTASALERAAERAFRPDAEAAASALEAYELWLEKER